MKNRMCCIHVLGGPKNCIINFDKRNLGKTLAAKTVKSGITLAAKFRNIYAKNIHQ